MKTKRKHPLSDAVGTQARKLLYAVIIQIPFDGWTETAFKSGCRQLGMEMGDAFLLFPRGIHDVITAFGEVADQAMLDAIEENRKFKIMRVRDKITFSVRARLEFLTPYRESMRRLMIWYALPLHWHLGVRRLYKTVDLIWRTSGDNSTDFNFYTKRGLLAGVLKATILFWLDDETIGCKATWSFLYRRIDEVMHAGQGILTFKSLPFSFLKQAKRA